MKKDQVKLKETYDTENSYLRKEMKKKWKRNRWRYVRKYTYLMQNLTRKQNHFYDNTILLMSFFSNFLLMYAQTRFYIST
jgi:hypothetical protein